MNIMNDYDCHELSSLIGAILMQTAVCRDVRATSVET